VLLTVRVVGIGKRDLGLSVEKPLNNFQALHKRMVLIADFVLACTESAARVNTVSLQCRQNF
jgi:hypothetical protein